MITIWWSSGSLMLWRMIRTISWRISRTLWWSWWTISWRISCTWRWWTWWIRSWGSSWSLMLWWMWWSISWRISCTWWWWTWWIRSWCSSWTLMLWRLWWTISWRISCTWWWWTWWTFLGESLAPGGGGRDGLGPGPLEPWCCGGCDGPFLGESLAPCCGGRGCAWFGPWGVDLGFIIGWGELGPGRCIAFGLLLCAGGGGLGELYGEFTLESTFICWSRGALAVSNEESEYSLLNCSLYFSLSSSLFLSNASA